MNTDKYSGKTYGGTSPATDKAKGRANELIGKAKTKIGGFTGDDDLEAEGYAQNVEGKAGRIKGEIKEKINDAKNMIKGGVGAVKDKFNDARR